MVTIVYGSNPGFNDNLVWFVRVKGKKVNPPTVGVTPYGHIEVMYSQAPTADDLTKQLAQLGIKLDPERIKRIARQNGNETLEDAELEELDKYLEQVVSVDRDLVLRLIVGNAEAYLSADPSLKKDPSFALRAIDWNPLVFQHLDKSLQENPLFLQKIVDQNIGWYKFLSNEMIEKLREDQKEKIRTLKKLNIEFPERFKDDPPYVLETVIKNRLNVTSNNPQLLAVVIYPKKDWNNAFSRNYHNSIRELIDHEYFVVYFETRTDEEFCNALKSASCDIGKKAQLLDIGGHATRERISLGADDPSKAEIEDERFYIDLSDKKEMQGHNLSACLSEDSVVMLRSCSAGKGKRFLPNVANMMKAIFPQARVFAPQVQSITERYLFDKNNKVIGAEYEGNVNVIIKILEKMGLNRIRWITYENK